MKQVGDYKILAHREAVWDALNDPDILGSCILGCESVEKIDETHFDISLKAKVGPVNAKMQVQVELTDLVPPESYTIRGGAKGGAAGAEEYINKAGQRLQQAHTNQVVPAPQPPERA